MESNRFTRGTQALFYIVTALAIIIAYLLFVVGKRELIGDASNYYALGQKMAETGLLGFADGLRTYGYPLFIAVFVKLFGSFPSFVSFSIFNAQLVLYLAACFYVARFFRSVFKSNSFSLAIYALTALNPFLIIYTPYLLSDLLAAVLALLAIIWSVTPVRRAESPSVGFREKLVRMRDHMGWTAFLSFFAASLGTMVRPANVSVIVAVAVIWVVRCFVFRNVTLYTIVAMFMGLCIPFVPQVVNNYRAYNQLQLLNVQSQSLDQLTWGMSYLKYGTLAIPGKPPSLYYFNPFYQPEITSPLEFATNQPIGYALTLSIHLFAMLDHDLVFPYVTDLDPWYKWPLAILNYGYLFVAAHGVIQWIRRTVKRKRIDQVNLIFLGMLLGATSYLFLYIFVAVESRFSLPVYLWMTPFFIYGAGKINEAILQRREGSIVRLIFAGWLFLCASTFLSNWIQLQAPVLLAATATYPCSNLEHLLDANMGNQIQISGYAVNPKQVSAGQDNVELILGWQYLPRYSGNYEFQVDLVDARGHVWSHGTRTSEHICSSGNGQTAGQDGSRFKIPLLPTMPEGQYKLVFNAYDRKNDQSLAVIDSAGKGLGTDFIVTDLYIPKNKNSFSVSQLPIENPLLIDLGEMRLLGDVPPRETISPGEVFEVGLYWRARSKPKGDYTVTIELRDANGKTVFTHQSKPADGTYPTTLWEAGEVLLDWHNFQIPYNIAPGLCDIYVALGEESTGTSLGEVKISSLLIAK